MFIIIHVNKVNAWKLIDSNHIPAKYQCCHSRVELLNPLNMRKASTYMHIHAYTCIIWEIAFHSILFHVFWNQYILLNSPETKLVMFDQEIKLSFLRHLGAHILIFLLNCKILCHTFPLKGSIAIIYTFSYMKHLILIWMLPNVWYLKHKARNRYVFLSSKETWTKFADCHVLLWCLIESYVTHIRQGYFTGPGTNLQHGSYG